MLNNSRLQIVMESVPKIAPVWQDISLKDVFRSQHRVRHFAEKIPDYGGIGLDVCRENDQVKCTGSKSTTNRVHFSAEICALPFSTMHKVTKVSDPCLELHKQQQESFIQFCAKLQNQRLKMNSAHNFKYRKEVLSCLEKLKKSSSRKSLQSILVPEKVIELSKEISQPVPISDTNFSYAGGCLEHSYLGDSPVLLHPSGKNLNKLAIIQLEESHAAKKRFNSQSSTQHSVKLKGKNILQISSELNGLCYVRQKESIHYVNFMNLNEIKTRTMKEKGAVHIAASPYNPSELLSVLSDGTLQLRNIVSRKRKLTKKVLDERKMLEFPRQCGFGSHPFSAFCLSNRQLNLYDVRLKKNRVSTLFSVGHPSCCAKEELSVLRSLCTNTFQHFAASDRHLFLCDERYPHEPVMIWNHVLSARPMYCTNIRYSDNPSDVMVLLGTQVSRETCAISLRSSMTEIQPSTLTLPFLVSKPSDCIDSLKLQGVSVDDLQCARFHNSLVGLSAMRHVDRNGFTCFQMTSLGDVFYQDYRESLDTNNFRIGPGCVLPPVDEVRRRLSPHCFIPQTRVDEGSISNDSLMNFDVDLKEILRIPREISADCITCRCDGREKEFVQSDPCPSCGLDNLQSRQLSEAAANLGVICSESGKIHSGIDTSALSGFTDSRSESVLQCWSRDSDAAADDVDLSDLHTGMPPLDEQLSWFVEKSVDGSQEISEVRLHPRALFEESLYDDLFEGSRQTTQSGWGQTPHSLARESAAGF